MKLVLNERETFCFIKERFVLVFLAAAFLLLMGLYPNAEVSFGKQANPGMVRLTRVLVIFVVVTQMLFMVRLAKTSDKSFRLWEEGENPVDAYQELTVALSEGKVDLNNLIPSDAEAEQEGIAQLEQLDNPYEWAQRDGIRYKWDRAFYQGKYYCYFGIVPAVLFYLPLYLLFDKLLNTHFLALTLSLVAVLIMAKLVYDLAQKRKQPVNLWLLLCGILGYVHTTMIVFSCPNSNFYEVARISGLLFSMLGIDLCYTAFREGTVSKLRLTFGALSMAFAVGSRPNAIFTSLLVVPIVWNGLRKVNSHGTVGTDAQGEDEIEAGVSVKTKWILAMRQVFCKGNIANLLCFMMPYIVVGLCIMVYNYVRFDSIFEFGAKYQLTVFDTGYYTLSDFRKIPVAIYEGFFSLPEPSAVFPFFHLRMQQGDYYGYLYRIYGIGLFSYPLMWLLLLLPWSLKRGIRQMGDRGFVCAASAVGLFSCYVTTVMGGVSHGYTVDFAWLIYLPVIYVIFDLYDRAKDKKIAGYVIGILLLLTVSTVVLNSLLSLAVGTTDMANSNPDVFYRIKEAIVFWN